MSKTNHATAETATEVAPVATQTLLIQGVSFIGPAPYAEGHVLTASEASVMNQTYGENLRNNFATKVKAAKDLAVKATTGVEGIEPSDTLSAETLSALAAEFAAYAAAYVFHGKRTAKAPLDPVGKEAHKIAKSLVLEALRKRNIDLKTLAEGKLDELIEGVLAKNPDIKAEAERRIAATKAVAADALEGLV